MATGDAPSLSYATCLIPLGGASLLALASAHALTPWLGPLGGAHVLLAVGVLPLVLGAVGYFTPALTQTRAAPLRLAAAPGLALLAGIAALGALRGSLEWLALALPLALLAAAGLLGWTQARARAGLGDPHPCLRWYQASLLCLIAALIAIGLAALHPAWWLPLRRVHLHLNLLGFVGLAAAGTLHVLLPTVGGFSDPSAARRLHRGLPFALGGVALVSLGASVTGLRPVAYLGALCWAVPLQGLAAGIARHRDHFPLGLHTPGLPLVAAVLGLALTLTAGALGGPLGIEPGALLGLFGFAFLFPLVTGALAHLLPVWRWPGRDTPARRRAARGLGWGAGLRALAFPALGVAHACGVPWAAPAGGGIVLVFLAQVVVALARAGEVPVEPGV